MTVRIFLDTTRTSSSPPRSDINTADFASELSAVSSVIDVCPATTMYLLFLAASILRLSSLYPNAKSARNIIAKVIKKRHVPAYCAVDVGVHCELKIGVVVLV